MSAKKLVDRKTFFEMIRKEARRRGHENATVKSGLGGAMGGVLGSFFGPGGAAIGAAIGAAVGYAVGREEDR